MDTEPKRPVEPSDSLKEKLNNLVREGIMNPNIFRALSEPDKRMGTLEGLGFDESERMLFKKEGKLSVEHLLKRPVEITEYMEFVEGLLEQPPDRGN